MNQYLEALRHVVTTANPKKELIGDLKRDLKPGWLLPILLEIDARTWGRWSHWFNIMELQRIGDAPIPQIQFDPHQQHGKKMIERCLNAVTNYGGWQGWSSFKYFNFFLDWLLFGFGYNRTLPEEGSEMAGASMRLYQLFNLETLIAFPNDDLGDMLAENAHGKHNGFFPTPLDLCSLMAQMNYSDGDNRAMSVCDPCLGTGRMLLVASNYSYRLYGMDKDETVLKAAIVNGFMYAPWMVKAFPDSFFAESGSIETRAPIEISAPTIATKYEQLALI